MATYNIYYITVLIAIVWRVERGAKDQVMSDVSPRQQHPEMNVREIGAEVGLLIRDSATTFF